ncbi:GCR1-dependent translation factor 1 [Erysiphe neolycopersici]|uniref:GCR1-dependent translation factor 1 n=1 Tax=Erysiphe neolycopersici TaxID=212602 RepID=A0A420HYE0_9PEZI|nr:GCR1-dependent translation factor 1 [Erysiphe neolycopersici]
MKCKKYPTLILALHLSLSSTAINIPIIDRTHISVPNHGKSGGLESGLKSPVDLNSKTKYDIGTKDAPVDGKDGKPHAGPWVGSEKDTIKATNNAKSTIKPHMRESEAPKGNNMNYMSDIMISQDEKIPETNDGVMDDPTREPPKHGTTGTEGGVSEKDKARKAQEGQTGERIENMPASPKEAPLLSLDTKIDPKNEKPKTKDAQDDKIETTNSLSGLEKPNDLPDRLSNQPNPLPNSAKKDHLDISKSDENQSPKYELLQNKGNDGFLQPLHSYFLSLTMILFSEIGDKTFLVAVLMAMKNDRLLVFSAAFSALLLMTVLSATLGHAVPILIPRRFTNFLAAGLFIIFGLRMLKESLDMSPEDGVGAEMKEVELELEKKEHLVFQSKKERSSISPYNLEMGFNRSRTRRSRSRSRLPSIPRSPSSSPERSPSPQRSTLKSTVKGLNNLLSLLLSPAWVQTFVMTFLAEWGDRSQIATIAMAAGQDYWWVTAGAVCGHAACTGVAVIGGRVIAGKVSIKLGKSLPLIDRASGFLIINLRIVTQGGAWSFLVFGVIYLIEAFYN